jgi:hypothetical protein
MNHPAKPTPIEPRDVPVWQALLRAVSHDGQLAMRTGEVAAVLMLEGVPLQPRDAEAALVRIIDTGLVERMPGGLRVVSHHHRRHPAADNDEDIPHGST